MAITIIGILSSIAFAALMRARQAANVANTKSTIARLHSQIQTKWDSYRIRKVPVNPQFILTAVQAGGYPYVFQALQTWFGLTLPIQANPNNNRHVAAVRLLAMRELQRYEMPCCWGDLVGVDTNPMSPTYGLPLGTPGNYQLSPPSVLTSPPSLAYTYLRKLNAATPAIGFSTAQQAQQIAKFESAECLYMVVTSGLEDVAFGGELSVPKSVGDADGDGLPEFQDAWTLMDRQYPVSGPQRQPIAWIRWPAGFHNYLNASYYTSPLLGITVSDLDPDPTGIPPAIARESSIANHDYFDTLKVDLPLAPTVAIPFPAPRGYAMMPLIYSVGPDGIANLSPDYDGVNEVTVQQRGYFGQWYPAAPPSAPPPSWLVDPYMFDQYGNNMAGTPTGPYWTDNIHNHLIESR